LENTDSCCAFNPAFRQHAEGVGCKTSYITP
jgi:hypothetical protein